MPIARGSFISASSCRVQSHNKLDQVFEECSIDLMAAKDKQEVTTIVGQFKNKQMLEQQ